MTQNYKPTLSGLTEKECVIKALDEYDNLGETDFFDKHAYHANGNGQGVLRKFQPSTAYPLYYRYGRNPGQEYPSKAIAGVAYYIQHNRRLGNFKGGLDSVVPKLKDLDPEGNYFRFDDPYGPLGPDYTSQQYSDIPELERSQRIREYKNYTFEEIARVVKQWLLIGDLGHRELDSEILGIDSGYSRGFQSMGVLHYLGLRQSFKGIFRERQLPSVINELRNNHQDFTEIIRYLESEDQGLEIEQTNRNTPQSLMSFLKIDMQMQAVYQPVMIRTLLNLDGKAARSFIAKDIMAEDNGRRGDLATYESIVKDLPGRILENRGWVSFDEVSDEFSLNLQLTEISNEELEILTNTCTQRLNDYKNSNRVRAGQNRSNPSSQSRLDQIKQDLEAIGEFTADNDEDARQRRDTQIAIRQGQKQFRDNLLEIYETKCAVTRYDYALEACHIEPYKGPQTNDIRNGLLLKSDIHFLFDQGKVAIDTSNWTLILSEELTNSSYSDLSGCGISLPAEQNFWPDVDALNKHRSVAGL